MTALLLVLALGLPSAQQASAPAATRSVSGYVVGSLDVLNITVFGEPELSRRYTVDADGTIRVPETTTAVDCGFYVNPERIRSQMEGAAVMGMSHALYSGITFKNGAVEQGNFSDFNIATMGNYPQTVAVHIVDAPAGTHAGGIGEPGLPPFAPALANAVFASTGKRLRNMPMGEKVT